MTEHSLSRRRNEECSLCPGLDGLPGACDHSVYPRKYIRFMKAHAEAFTAAYLDGNSQASSNELERLSREYQTLPDRFHVCTCNPQHCKECLRMARTRPTGPDVGISVGKTQPVTPAMPSPAMLDVRAGYA